MSYTQGQSTFIQEPSLALMRLLPSLLLPLMLGVFSGLTTAASISSIRVAVDDIPGIDMLNVLTAVEQAKQQGLEITIDYLRSEDIAVQAVLLGQADIGMGTPYGLIQNTDAPIRILYQLNTLRFFPIVNNKYYKSWKDLDGADMYTHGRGSGTEAIMQLMANMHGITYKKMHYLPDADVRARAMLNGWIKASIFDSRRRQLLLEQGGGRFSLLPIPEFRASDETLYANTAFLDENGTEVRILVEELLRVWRQINRNPDFMVEAWRRHKLPPIAGANLEDKIRHYYSEMVKIGAFPDKGGGLKAAKADFDFYQSAGTLKNDVNQLKVEDYWDLGPLERALEKLEWVQ
jgi:NitT/TauT family transport system substrate-binding protein